jgi:hypothetical protein
MKISEALYVAGGHLNTDRQCQYNLRGLEHIKFLVPLSLRKRFTTVLYEIRSIMKHIQQNWQLLMRRPCYTHVRKSYIRRLWCICKLTTLQLEMNCHVTYYLLIFFNLIKLFVPYWTRTVIFYKETKCTIL